MKLKVYNLTGKSIGTMEVSDVVFNVAIKPEIVHTVFVQQTNNQREPWADTKTKGEVSGGGKKPWAQKGTGRARHGSIRSPIWKGGGVTFGPLSTRNYKTKINKKIRRSAIKMCLTDKAQNETLLVIEDFNFTDQKTKVFAAFLKELPIKTKTVLVLTAGKDIKVIRMTKNLPKVETMRAEDINVMELLKNSAVVASKDAVKKIEEVFSK
ncbi:MAG: 50S ribosomal protein L4 [Candidatus Magasanikbacteria bacterium CG10_big_fil_rev_8_21_14_0_10_36_32]|uniref:Large ribosomal subunit protein uL4 n=1 Tax=Candidatus Magasanikbacteria bacterium CG10_big_fil_rev_8_21_14_0_10_36_32 TaxID=1974646 RepID=A0A2M6W6P0_9BACT|nr:MAG: 50S ribosomal protein L4 [Candidatus Magasanikbacteria bacterium CG10_big_fil_rev_8_21_14_0_10_36_32]